MVDERQVPFARVVARIVIGRDGPWGYERPSTCHGRTNQPPVPLPCYMMSRTLGACQR
jgi:hypothetical protein